MHAAELTELAALLAANGPALLAPDARIEPRRLDEYWTASKCRVDRWLRSVVVTPDMHRVHHSVDRAEHDANYGFNLSVWDRLFGTYVAHPKGGHEGMTLGLPQWQNLNPTRLGWSLALPFLRK